MQTIGFRWSLLWIAALTVSLFVTPRGNWTIDDSLKRIAAEQASGIVPTVVADGALRQRLESPEAFAPMGQPFAERVPGGFAVGFSPATRLLAKFWFAGGDLFAKLIPLLVALGMWWMLQRAGMEYGYLLLPLTFYTLVPWEHALAWLLCWPACWYVLGKPPPSKWQWLLAGGLLGFGFLLRPETAILGGVLVVYLLFAKRTREAGLAALGIIAVALSGWLLLANAQPEMLFAQVRLNYATQFAGFQEWGAHLPQGIYALLISCDRSAGISLLLLGLLLGGFFALRLAEKKNARGLLMAGGILLTAMSGLFWLRVFTHPLPPLALLNASSAAVALPWILILLLPPYRGRPAFQLGMLCTGIAILTMPIYAGVHWGPRLLLFALPLLLIDLYQTKRAQGWLFTGMLLLTLVQTTGSAALVYARASESSQHSQRLESILGNPAICTYKREAIDLAPLWGEREFFVTASKREFLQLLIELREAEVDTVWLHLDVWDSLYIEAFPQPDPVWPYRMSIVNAGSFYLTKWRVYELVMRRHKASWGDVLDSEAGLLMGENRWEKARKLEAEAVELQPVNAKFRVNYALALEAMEEIEEAIYQAEIAFDLDPELGQAEELLTLLRARQKSDSAESAQP